jgi:hypothetical protein
MPTAYTSPIADGITFNEYAMGCARAFGALIMMRDDPQNTEIPESFEASKYHKEAIEKEVAELNHLLTMDYATAAKKAREEHQKHIDYHAGEITKGEFLAAKYKAMLAEVEAYESPSSDHDNFKKFMADQITESMKFDCESNHHREAIESARFMSGEEWILNEKNRLDDSIAYHQREHQKELDRTNNRNEWVRKLRESLEKTQ